MQVPLRLSLSPVWQRNTDFFTNNGPSVWDKQLVPNFVATNSYTAHSYAQILHSFLNETQSPQESHIILEIGAGSGQLAFSILTRLEELIASRSSSFLYVIGEVSDSIIRNLSKNSQLLPFIERGILDFCVLNTDSATYAFELLVQKRSISCSSLPICIIANYVFNGLSMDAFYSLSGEDFEYKVKPSEDSDSMEWASQAVSAPYYTGVREDLNVVVERQIRDENTLLVPVGACDLIRDVAAMCGNTFVLLMGDQHQSFRGAPRFSGEEYWSLPVNFEAIFDYVRFNFAKTCFSSVSTCETEDFRVGLCVSNVSTPGTLSIFRQTVGAFSPQDLCNLVESDLSYYSLNAALSLVKLSQYDQTVFLLCAKRIKTFLSPERRQILSDAQLKFLTQTLEYVEKYHFGAYFSRSNCDDLKESVLLLKRCLLQDKSTDRSDDIEKSWKFEEISVKTSGGSRKAT